MNADIRWLVPNCSYSFAGARRTEHCPHARPGTKTRAVVCCFCGATGTGTPTDAPGSHGPYLPKV